MRDEAGKIAGLEQYSDWLCSYYWVSAIQQMRSNQLISNIIFDTFTHSVT